MRQNRPKRSLDGRPVGSDGTTSPQVQGRSAGNRAGTTTDVLGYLMDHRAELSRSHSVIADAILEQPTAFVEKPIEELVAWLGISAPTITRFARGLACEGLRDLKLKIMASMRVGARYFEPATPPATLVEVGERVALRAQRAVLLAQQTVDVAAIEKAVNTLTGNRTIYAFGSGGVSSWLVEEVQNRLFRLGMRVIPSNDHQMQMMLAATVERGDVVVCISLTGNNLELIRAARIAAGYGATTLALTVPNSPLSEQADIVLAPDVRDDGDVLGPTSLRYAFLTVIDMVAYGAAIRSRPAAQEKLRRIKQQFTTFRDPDDSQPVCD